VAIARGAILRGRKNLFAIHPVTNSEDFNFQARQMRGHPLFRELC
jgi:hypothetical protein